MVKQQLSTTQKLAKKVSRSINEQEQTSVLSFSLGVLFFVVVLFSLITVSWWLIQHFRGQESAPVTSIVVSGEMPYSHRNDIINAIEQLNMGNFFQVDVNEVQNLVLTLPWVYSVAVRKQWPNELKIYVVDQAPVAVWNGDFLINQFGEVFQADVERITHFLPRFYGPEGSETLALENYRNINGLLAYSALNIDELMLSERFSWQLTLSDGVTLNLGREERVERIQRFMDIYPIIKDELKAKIIAEKQQNQGVDYIDLRYDTGLAVGWKTIDEISHTQIQNNARNQTENKTKTENKIQKKINITLMKSNNISHSGYLKSAPSVKSLS